jgi:hypothetical protein
MNEIRKIAVGSSWRIFPLKPTPNRKFLLTLQNRKEVSIMNAKEWCIVIVFILALILAC